MLVITELIPHPLTLGLSLPLQVLQTVRAQYGAAYRAVGFTFYEQVDSTAKLLHLRTEPNVVSFQSLNVGLGYFLTTCCKGIPATTSDSRAPTTTTPAAEVVST